VFAIPATDLLLRAVFSFETPAPTAELTLTCVSTAFTMTRDLIMSAASRPLSGCEIRSVEIPASTSGRDNKVAVTELGKRLQHSAPLRISLKNDPARGSCAWRDVDD